MAIKDIFNNFFTFEEEEEIYEEKRSENPIVREREKTKEGISYRKETEVPDTEVTRKKVISQNQQNNHKSTKNNMKVVEKKNMANTKVVNMAEDHVYGSSKVCLFEPRVFSDTQDIADELKNRRATLVNLQRIDKISAKRIIDFLSGTVYAIGGDIQKIGTDIFLCTPDNVEVAGSITEMLDAPEESYED